MAKSRKLKRHVSVLVRHRQHVTYIGMISVEMANLELFLSELLGAVLRMNLYLSQILYLTPRAAIGRLAMLENIVEAAMKPTEGRKQIESLVGRAKEVIGKRHNIIHDTWGVRQEHKGVHRIALPMISKPKPVPIQTLKDLLRSIRRLCDDVRETTLEVIESWPPEERARIIREKPYPETPATD